MLSRFVLVGLLTAALLSNTVAALGIDAFSNICYTSQDCLLYSHAEPWDDDKIADKLSYNLVLPAAKDWKLDKCYYSAIRTSNDVDLRQTQSMSGKIRAKSNDYYGKHLPVLTGSGSVKKFDDPNNQISVLCHIRASSMVFRAALNDTNTSIEMTFMNGAGNTRNGRLTVKPTYKFSGSVSFAASGDLNTVGNGFTVSISDITSYPASLRVIGSNYLLQYQIPSAPTDSVTSCNITYTKNSTTSTYSIDASISSDETDVFQQFSTESSVLTFDLSSSTLNETLSNDLVGSSDITIHCPELAAAKVVPGIPTPTILEAVSNGLEYVSISHIEMENSTLFPALFGSILLTILSLSFYVF